MNVEMGNEAEQFIFWEYLFGMFGTVSTVYTQCNPDTSLLLFSSQWLSKLLTLFILYYILKPPGMRWVLRIWTYVHYMIIAKGKIEVWSYKKGIHRLEHPWTSSSILSSSQMKTTSGEISIHTYYLCTVHIFRLLVDQTALGAGGGGGFWA